MYNITGDLAWLALGGLGVLGFITLIVIAICKGVSGATKKSDKDKNTDSEK